MAATTPLYNIWNEDGISRNDGAPSVFEMQYFKFGIVRFYSLNILKSILNYERG